MFLIICHKSRDAMKGLNKFVLGEFSLAHQGVLFTAESPFSLMLKVKEGAETAETRAFWATVLLPFGRR